jgi:hypothetical protein
MPIIQLGGEAWLDSISTESETDDYQIGEEWGKIPASEQDLSDPALARAAGATARLGGGTAFYLGVFKGAHIVATNEHVCSGPSGGFCRFSNARFPQIGVSAGVRRLIGNWTEIDFALLEIAPDEAEAAKLAQVAANLDFTSPMYSGQPLITAGFGFAGNPNRQMVVASDSDCIVFSADNDFRFMRDPDDVNPGPHEVWSFANGCDVSHGDSGSAMVDRNTGLPVGLIWTGRIPKNPVVRDSEFLSNIFEAQSEEIWQELSYGVPAIKIKEVLQEKLAEWSITGERAEIVEAILAN